MDKSRTPQSTGSTNNRIRLIRQAMQDPDRLVIVFDYADKKGNLSRRVASPIRFCNGKNVLTLCLSREEPRMFQIDRIENLRLAGAEQFVMPVPIIEMPAATAVVAI